MALVLLFLPSHGMASFPRLPCHALLSPDRNYIIIALLWFQGSCFVSPASALCNTTTEDRVNSQFAVSCRQECQQFPRWWEMQRGHNTYYVRLHFLALSLYATL